MTMQASDCPLYETIVAEGRQATAEEIREWLDTVFTHQGIGTWLTNPDLFGPSKPENLGMEKISFLERISHPSNHERHGESNAPSGLWAHLGLPLAPCRSLWDAIGLPLAVLWAPFGRLGPPEGYHCGCLGRGVEIEKVTKYYACHQFGAKTNSSPDPADSLDQVASSAAQNLPSTRAGGQDDVSSQANSLKTVCVSGVIVSSSFY